MPGFSEALSPDLPQRGVLESSRREQELKKELVIVCWVFNRRWNRRR